MIPVKTKSVLNQTAVIRIIERLIQKGKNELLVREKALEIIQGCPERDYFCEAESIHNWIRRNLRFKRDIYGIETLQTALYTLGLEGDQEFMAGDCDDYVIAGASLMQSVGLNTRLVLASNLQSRELQHIFLEVNVAPDFEQGKWIASDPSMGFNFGEEYSAFTRREIV